MAGLRVLVACEFSGIVRRAFLDAGADAWSCDLLPAEDGSNRHIVGDARDLLDDGWDLLIAHPPCTRLCNSGVRWLSVPPSGRTLADMRAFGNTKRSLDGTHHQVSAKHLPLYLAELDFKYNTREQTDGARKAIGIPKIVGKRLMLRRLAGRA